MSTGAVSIRQPRSRRPWPLLPLLWLVGCGPQAGASGGGAEDSIFEWLDLGRGLYASVVREGVSPSAYAASLVIVNDDHVVVVDARDTPAAARDLMAHVRSVTALPIRYLVNTHWHSDHVYGNQAFLDAYPELRIVGHPYTADAVLTLGKEHRADEDNTARPVPPNELVRDSLLLRSGRRTLRIVHPGPAHTRGDVVIEIQPDSVLVVGDLIEEGLPYLADGTVTGTARALAEMLRRPVIRVFGAHVRRIEDRSRLETQGAFFAELVRLVSDAAAQGVPVEQAAAEIRMESFRAHFTAGDSTLPARYPTFVAGLVKQAYGELTRDPR